MCIGENLEDCLHHEDEYKTGCIISTPQSGGNNERKVEKDKRQCWLYTVCSMISPSLTSPFYFYRNKRSMIKCALAVKLKIQAPTYAG
jgi:hypothetical protein